MAEQPFSMTHAFRQTDEYKELLKVIQKDCPHLPLYLCEVAISLHKNNPNFYKQDKQHKKVLSEPFTAPKNKGEKIIKDAIQVQDFNDDILKQREDFYAKHGITEQSEFIPTVIQEVEA